MKGLTLQSLKANPSHIFKAYQDGKRVKLKCTESKDNHAWLTVIQAMKTLSAAEDPHRLVPLFVCTAVGMTGAFGYLFRLATKNPDTSWDRKNNQLPYLKMKPTDQYKFYSPVRDYSKEKAPADRPVLD